MFLLHSDSGSVTTEKAATCHLPRDHMSLPSNVPLNDLSALTKGRESSSDAPADLQEEGGAWGAPMFSWYKKKRKNQQTIHSWKFQTSEWTCHSVFVQLTSTSEPGIGQLSVSISHTKKREDVLWEKARPLRKRRTTQSCWTQNCRLFWNEIERWFSEKVRVMVIRSTEEWSNPCHFRNRKSKNGGGVEIYVKMAWNFKWLQLCTI